MKDSRDSNVHTLVAVKIRASKTWKEIAILTIVLGAFALGLALFGWVQWAVCQERWPGISFMDCIGNRRVGG
jgi:uncharacterized protein HemX